MESVVVEPDRHGHVLPHDLLGDERQRIGLGIVASQVDDGHVQQVGQNPYQLALVQHAHVDEGLADSLARSFFLLDDQRLRDVLLRNEAAADQEGAEGLSGGGVAGPRRCVQLRSVDRDRDRPSGALGLGRLAQIGFRRCGRRSFLTSQFHLSPSSFTVVPE